MKIFALVSLVLPLFHHRVGAVEVTHTVRKGDRDLQGSSGSPFLTLLESAYNTITRKKGDNDNDCNAANWLLQTTWQFGVDSSKVNVADVTTAVATASVAVLEAYMQEYTFESGICSIETNSMTLIDIAATDTSANLIDLNIDWDVSQTACGSETLLHAALKSLNYQTIIDLWAAYGVQQGDSFVGAIKTASYTCPRDSACP